MYIIRDNGQITGKVSNIDINANIFRNNINVNSVDLCNLSFNNNSASLAFANCSNLTSVTNIADSIDDIGGMFYNCSNLTSTMPIPNSVTNKTYGQVYDVVPCYTSSEIYNMRYRDSYNGITGYIMTNSFYPVYNINYNRYNACVYVENRNSLIPVYSDDIEHLTSSYMSFYGRSNSGFLTINAIRNSLGDVIDTQHVINAGLYENCYNLTNIEINSNSVTDLSYAFKNCSNLVNVYINCSNLTSMTNTFMFCTNLVNAPTIPNSVTDMYYTFGNCTNLVDAPVIPNSVTNISGIFSNCTNLVNAPVIPNSVTNMCDAFKNTNINLLPEIPNNVTNMVNAFAFCNNLLNISLLLDENKKFYRAFCNTYFNNVDFQVTNNNYSVSSILYHTQVNNLNIISNSYTSGDQIGFGDGPYRDGFRFSHLNLNCDTIMDASGLISWGHDIGLQSVNCVLNNASSIASAFRECENLRVANLVIPNVTNMYGTFEQCSSLVDAPVIPNGVTNMSQTFYYCRSLVDAPVIPNGVTNMSQTFYDCERLVNASAIPNAVINMCETFARCSRLVNVSEIPGSVTDMGGTFYSCSSLVNAPAIPNAVTNMICTFDGCSSLVNAPVIPENVIRINGYEPGSGNLGGLFKGCTNLTGDIEILSENIPNAYHCFYGTSLEKNVYIPFTYQNGEYTATYNAFVNEGYSMFNRVNGVLLKMHNAPSITFDITPNTSSTEIYLNGYKLENEQTYDVLKNNDYMIYNPDYMLIVGEVNNLTENEQYTLTKDLTSITGYTITLNVDQTDCEVIFDINGKKFSANVNGNLYTLTLISDQQITIGYTITKNGYSKVIDTVTFNNSDITENITMEESSLIDFVRPNLSSNGTIGGDSFAIQALNYPSGAYRAFDASAITYWSCNSRTEELIIYNPKELMIESLTFTFRDNNRYESNDMYLYTSSDGENWSEQPIASITGNYNKTCTMTVSDPDLFNYYKIIFNNDDWGRAWIYDIAITGQESIK